MPSLVGLLAWFHLELVCGNSAGIVVSRQLTENAGASMPEKTVEEQSSDVGACEEHGGQQVHRRVAEAEIAGEQELQKSCLEPDRCDTKYWAEEHRYNCNS